MNRCLRTLFFLVSAALFFCVPAAAFAQSRGAASRGGPPAQTAQVVFRCAFWETPKNPGKYFVLEDRKYKYLNILEMAFAREYVYRGPLPIPVFRKATEAEIEQRKAEGIKAADAAYVPVASINPRGMRDVGVVFLPGALEKKDEKLQLVFDCSEKNFPYGSIRVLNFSTRDLLGRLTPRGGEAENFRLRHGSGFLSKPQEKEREIYDVRFAAIVNKKPKLVYSSGAAFFKSSRVLLFVIPADPESAKNPNAVPELDFRLLKDYKPVAPPPAEEPGEKA